MENEYPHVFASIKEEEYEIEFPECSHIEEIIINDEIAGIVGCQYLEPETFYLQINEFYVLPEYRGNDAFYNYILDVSSRVNTKAIIRKPSKIIMDILLKHELAYKVSKEVICSEIDLLVDVKDLFTNDKIAKLYNEIPDSVYRDFIGNLYDINICGMIFIDGQEFFAKRMSTVCLSSPRLQDIKNNNLEKKLKKVSNKYLYKIGNAVEKAFNNIFDQEYNLSDHLWDYADINEVLGSEDELKEDYVKCLEEHNLNKDDGIKIIEKIEDAILEDEIYEENLIYRMNYLLDNPEKEAVIGETVDIKNKCPYCEEKIESYYKACPNCGYKLKDELDMIDMSMF